MPVEKKVSIHVLRGAAAAAKRSSSALATTASTCLIPGGTSLLVGCVLGKNLTVSHQRARSPLDLEVLQPSDNGLASEAPASKERAGFPAVPRSMSVNSPRITDAIPLPFTGKFSETNTILLFDKVVSATDCRSTGHFVLPKRKVEEHFPPLSKPGGVWMSLVDDVGKKWSFEFCFWYSKESRIYYFKKFYPYVQARNLRGGDTVYFSRLEPEGTILIGIRKQKPASIKHSKAIKLNASKDELEEPVLSKRDSKIHAKEGNSVLDEAALHEDLSATPSTEYTSVSFGLTKSSDMRKRRRLSPHILPTPEIESVGHFPSDEAVMGSSLGVGQSATPELFEHVNMKPGSMGSGGTSSALTMEDYYEWEDIQNLFRAPPGAIVTTTSVEGHEIEECEEPPVLTKKIFYSAEIPEDDQWVKCDDCGCWRRIPADAFVPASWVCSDNEWDFRRADCSAPQELSDREMDELLERLSETDNETGSEMESFDDDSEISDSPPTEEGETYCKQPRTWSEAKPGKGHQICTGCDKLRGSAAGVYACSSKSASNVEHCQDLEQGEDNLAVDICNNTRNLFCNLTSVGVYVTHP